eukprot:2909686-Alexandrium_andersonii.AAC.1
MMVATRSETDPSAPGRRRPLVEGSGRTGLPCDRGQEGSPRRDVTATVAFGSCATRASRAAVL